jgi:sulfatase maturation enzyme AslB (radical SAM superfamily)
MAVLTRDAVEYRKGMEKFAGKFMGPQGDALFQCGAGKGLCIDAYGFGQPCMVMHAPELTIDLHKSSWQNQDKVQSDLGNKSTCGKHNTLATALEYYKGLREMKATNPEYLRRCAVCFLKGLCEQCPAKSWANHGTLDTPVEYLCAVAHAQARWMGWLMDSEKAWEVRDWKVRTRGRSGGVRQ